MGSTNFMLVKDTYSLSSPLRMRLQVIFTSLHSRATVQWSLPLPSSIQTHEFAVVVMARMALS